MTSRVLRRDDISVKPRRSENQITARTVSKSPFWMRPARILSPECSQTVRSTTVAEGEPRGSRHEVTGSEAQKSRS